MAIWPEERGWSDDIGALAILDGASLLDGQGRLRIEAVRDRIGRRLHLVPRFRQLLYRRRLGLGRPCRS
jgi:diacylglycerol O-acyltransferase / wax synthase